MLPLPDHIGPYRVLRKIGEGGMGLVLEAVHPQIERRVAIKLLRPEYARDTMLTERLFREALAVNRIEHPCVVQISEHGQLPDGSVYLVMEFLRGQTLAAWMEQHPGPAPVRLVLGLMVQITSALAAAHDKQVVHRDLKPENLMLLEDVAGLSELGAPRVKILDFGIAKVNRDVAPGETGEKAARGHAKTATNVVMGTPQYMSPEQCQGAVYANDKSDVYSLGVMLFELLTGRLPFEAQSVGQLIGMHLFKEPPRVRELAPSVPEGLAARVQAMLAKEKAERPTMRELQREFERMLRAGGSDPGTEPPAASGSIATAPAVSTSAGASGPGPSARGGSRLLLAAGALTLLGGAGALALRLRASPVPTETPVPVAVRAVDAGLAPAPPRARIRWSVTSQPAGATVLRAEDGQVLGRTPWEHEELQAPGEAQLLLRYDGFVEESVLLPRDRDAVVQRRLHPIKLSLPAPATPHTAVPPQRKRPGR